MDISEVDKTIEALQIGKRLSETAASGNKLSLADQKAAEAVLTFPIVAQVRLCPAKHHYLLPSVYHNPHF